MGELKYLLLFVIAVVIGGLAVAHFRDPEIIRVPVPGPVQQFDSTGWVREAMLIEQSQITDSVKRVNQKLYDRIAEGRQQILQLSEITATLRLERDSLQQITMDISIDTSYTTSTTYTDSLFEVQSFLDVQNKTLNYSNNLIQLRPITITTATATQGDRVYFYVESPDFEELNIESYTTIKQPKKTWHLWLGSGILAGIVGWELIR